MAEPSRRNSGFDTTSKGTRFDWCRVITSRTNSPVPTGTVDLLTMTVYRSMAWPMPLATASTAPRSVSPSRLEGVPTAMKTISDRGTAAPRSVVKASRRRRASRLASRPLSVRLGGGPAEEGPREGGERRHRGRHPHDHAAEPLVLQRGELKDAGRRRVERIERRGGQRDECRDHRHGHAHQEQGEQLGAGRRARGHRVRREGWPPREAGRRGEGQV